MPTENWLSRAINAEVESHWAQAKSIVDDIKAFHNGDVSADLLANEVIKSKARLAAFIGLGL